MSGFWWLVIIAGAIWFFFKSRSQKKEVQAFEILEGAKPWFEGQQMDPDSTVFNIYSDPSLTINTGATVLVGSGTKNSGERVGFALEVIPGSGVVAGEVIEPWGVASQHKHAAMEAQAAGKPLITMLQAMSAAHRAKYG